MDAEPGIPPPPPNSVQLVQLSYAGEHNEHHHDPREGPVTSTTDQETREDNQASEGTDQVVLPRQINTADVGTSHVPPSPREIVPECIGRETCPICIIDFEEGDDLRVLPCEGKHRFHQSCVDPWLLELSGSCPLCRQGKLTFGRFGKKRLMRTIRQISVRWRRSYPEDRKARHLQPTVIAYQVHLYDTAVGFLVTCDSRWDANEELAVETKNLHRCRKLERISRRMYSPDNILSKLYASLRVESKRYITRLWGPFRSSA